MADLEGDTASQYKLQQELEELESRATELDRKRTNNISSIRSVQYPAGIQGNGTGQEPIIYRLSGQYNTGIQGNGTGQEENQ